MKKEVIKTKVLKLGQPFIHKPSKKKTQQTCKSIFKCTCGEEGDFLNYYDKVLFRCPNCGKSHFFYMNCDNTQPEVITSDKDIYRGELIKDDFVEPVCVEITEDDQVQILFTTAEFNYNKEDNDIEIILKRNKITQSIRKFTLPNSIFKVSAVSNEIYSKIYRHYTKSDLFKNNCYMYGPERAKYIEALISKLPDYPKAVRILVDVFDFPVFSFNTKLNAIHKYGYEMFLNMINWDKKTLLGLLGIPKQVITKLVDITWLTNPTGERERVSNSVSDMIKELSGYRIEHLLSNIRVCLIYKSMLNCDWKQMCKYLDDLYNILKAITEKGDKLNYRYSTYISLDKYLDYVTEDEDSELMINKYLNGEVDELPSSVLYPLYGTKPLEYLYSKSMVRFLKPYIEKEGYEIEEYTLEDIKRTRETPIPPFKTHYSFYCFTQLAENGECVYIPYKLKYYGEIVDIFVVDINLNTLDIWCGSKEVNEVLLKAEEEFLKSSNK